MEKNDLTARTERNDAMLMENSSLATVGVIASDRYGQHSTIAIGRTEYRRVTDTSDPTLPAWVAEIYAIRDHQDQKAFARIFGHFGPRVKAFLMRSGAAPDVAEECTQEVMATLWRKAHLFDPSRASAATWIYSIARNKQIDMIRKSRRPEPEDLPWGPEADPDPGEALTLQEETAKLGQALAALPEKQRDLIQRAYFGDLSHSEIAEQTGLPLGTIKSRIRLALDRLRHAMGN